MNDKEAAKQIQEAAIGISVAIDHLATVKLAMTDQIILMEKILAMQKIVATYHGLTPMQVDQMLADMDGELRRSVQSRLRRSPESDSQSGGEPPSQGLN